MNPLIEYKRVMIFEAMVFEICAVATAVGSIVVIDDGEDKVAKRTIIHSIIVFLILSPQKRRKSQHKEVGKTTQERD